MARRQKDSSAHHKRDEDVASLRFEPLHIRFDLHHHAHNEMHGAVLGMPDMTSVLASPPRLCAVGLQSGFTLNPKPYAGAYAWLHDSTSRHAAKWLSCSSQLHTSLCFKRGAAHQLMDLAHDRSLLQRDVQHPLQPALRAHELRDTALDMSRMACGHGYA